MSPLGIIQKGGSRNWIDDHSWWMILIGFQPSRWSRGTYLNVGAHWLWHENDNSLDYGNRVNSFVEFVNEDQFEAEFRKLIEQAVKKVNYYRSKFRSIHDVANVLLKEPNLGGWNLFHAGIACGLDKRGKQARKLFSALLKEESILHSENGSIELAWHRKLKERTAYLLELLDKPELFKKEIDATIYSARRSLHLKDLEKIEYD